MTVTPGNTSARFDAAALAGLDEPVRRYFTHALTDGAALARGARLRLSGTIKVGVWLRFDLVWEGDACCFSWRATGGPGPLRPLRPLRVHDQFAGGVGFMDIRLRPPLRRLPALKLLHAENDDAARSGAGRAALAALWVPGALLPDHGVTWRAESDELIVATWDVPPEKPELHISIGSDGAVTRIERSGGATASPATSVRRRGARRTHLRRGDYPKPDHGRLGARHAKLGALLQGRGRLRRTHPLALARRSETRMPAATTRALNLVIIVCAGLGGTAAERAKPHRSRPVDDDPRIGGDDRA